MVKLAKGWVTTAKGSNLKVYSYIQTSQHARNIQVIAAKIQPTALTWRQWGHLLLALGLGLPSAHRPLWLEGDVVKGGGGRSTTQTQPNTSSRAPPQGCHSRHTPAAVCRGTRWLGALPPQSLTTVAIGVVLWQHAMSLVKGCQRYG